MCAKSVPPDDDARAALDRPGDSGTESACGVLSGAPPWPVRDKIRIGSGGTCAGGSIRKLVPGKALAPMPQPKVPPSERINSSYRQLKSMTPDLHSAAKDLSKTIDELNDALEPLNLGVTAWATIASGEDENNGVQSSAGDLLVRRDRAARRPAGWAQKVLETQNEH